MPLIKEIAVGRNKIGFNKKATRTILIYLDEFRE